MTSKTFVQVLLHQMSRTGSPNSHRRLSFHRCSTNCQGQDLQFTAKTFVPALVHQLSRTGFPIHTEDNRSCAAPPTVKDRISKSRRKLSFQHCSTNFQGQDLQSTPKTFVTALLHQLSKTGSPIRTEEFRSSAAPPTVKDGISSLHRRLSFQRCSTNCQEHDLQFTPKTFVPALLHQLSRTGSPIHTEDFRSSAAPPTVKDGISSSHRRLPFQRCPPMVKDRFSNSHRLTFDPALLHQLSRTGSSIHTEGFRSSAAPSTVKGRISNAHRKLSFQRWSTNGQRQVLQFMPKIFVPALLHQLSRTGSPIHSENFRSSVAPPTVKGRFSNSHRRLSFQRCSTNCQGHVLQFTPKTFAPRCSTNCQGQVLQFTPRTFIPALLHQLSRTGTPLHTEDFRSSTAPPTVKDTLPNSQRRLSSQRCSRQLSRTSFPIHTEDFRSSAAPPTVKTGSPIHTEDFRPSAAPPTVKDTFSNSHSRLSLQRCSTNCRGQVLQFTPKTFDPALLHLSRTGSPTHTEDFRSSAAPPTVKDRFSNSHRRLSQQRCSTNCQGQVLQFTPKTFAAALLHQLSKTGFPIHTEVFRSSAAPPTVKNRISNSHRRLLLQRYSTNCQGQDLQFTSKTFVPRCSTNSQGQDLHFTPKTFVPALLHQLSRTGSPNHTEDFRSNAAPPTVKDRFSNSHRTLSIQRCSTKCQGQDLQFTPQTFVPALLHQLSRTGSPSHTEDYRSSAAPPTVKDRISNSHRGLSLQRCSTNCQGQDLQFTPKTFVPALLHQLSRTGFPNHTEDFRSSAAPPTVKDRISNSHPKLSSQRCSTNCQGQVLQLTPKTFAPALLHRLSRTRSPIHTEDSRSSAAPPTVKDRFSNSHQRLSGAAPPTVKDSISN